MTSDEMKKGPNGNGSPSRKVTVATLPSSAWFGRITGALALCGALLLGATAVEAILATAVVLALAEIARSRLPVRRFGQHAPGQPDRDLRPYTSQLP